MENEDIIKYKDKIINYIFYNCNSVKIGDLVTYIRKLNCSNNVNEIINFLEYENIIDIVKTNYNNCYVYLSCDALLENVKKKFDSSYHYLVVNAEKVNYSKRDVDLYLNSVLTSRFELLKKEFGDEVIDNESLYVIGLYDILSVKMFLEDICLLDRNVVRKKYDDRRFI